MNSANIANRDFFNLSHFCIESKDLIFKLASIIIPVWWQELLIHTSTLHTLGTKKTLVD